MREKEKSKSRENRCLRSLSAGRKGHLSRQLGTARCQRDISELFRGHSTPLLLQRIVYAVHAWHNAERISHRVEGYVEADQCTASGLEKWGLDSLMILIDPAGG